MSIFDGKRLPSDVFKLDVERMRRGWYSYKYFENIMRMLTRLSEDGYVFPKSSKYYPKKYLQEKILTGDIEVEMQWFTRRPGTTVVVGVDKALAMLRHCTGYWDGDRFINTWHELEVWAVHDGDLVHYYGDPKQVQPVIRVRGRYRDFALLETPTLGISYPRQPDCDQCL
jgi:nicotinate phosphoribosyltransferase